MKYVHSLNGNIYSYTVILYMSTLLKITHYKFFSAYCLNLKCIIYRCYINMRICSSLYLTIFFLIFTTSYFCHIFLFSYILILISPLPYFLSVSFLSFTLLTTTITKFLYKCITPAANLNYCLCAFPAATFLHCLRQINWNIILLPYYFCSLGTHLSTLLKLRYPSSVS